MKTTRLWLIAFGLFELAGAVLKWTPWGIGPYQGRLADTGALLMVAAMCLFYAAGMRDRGRYE